MHHQHSSASCTACFAPATFTRHLRPLLYAACPCCRRRRLCSPKVPRLLSYLLGSSANLVAIRKDQAVAIRSEYHAFRNRAVWIMGTAPMLLFLGMKRADAVAAEGGHAAISLTPALLTGERRLLCCCCYCCMPTLAQLRAASSWRAALAPSTPLLLRLLRRAWPCRRAARPSRPAGLLCLACLLLRRHGAARVHPARQRQPHPQVVDLAPHVVVGGLAADAVAAHQQPE